MTVSTAPRTRVAPRALAWRAAVAVIAFNLVAALVAMATDWRARFDPPPDQGSVASEWAIQGSAISAPLAPLTLLAAAALLARRADRWWGLIGLVGIAFAGSMFVLGGVGEYLGTASEHTPRAVLVLAALVHVPIGLTLVVLAVRDGIVTRRGTVSDEPTPE